MSFSSLLQIIIHIAHKEEMFFLNAVNTFHIFSSNCVMFGRWNIHDLPFTNHKWDIQLFSLTIHGFAASFTWCEQKLVEWKWVHAVL